MSLPHPIILGIYNVLKSDNMIEVKGDLWSFHEHGKTICITINLTITRFGELIMGAGCALEAKDRFPGLPKLLGWHVETNKESMVIHFKDWNIISFPTKYHYRNKSDINLIERSLRGLDDLRKTLDEDYGITEIFLPRPGCGYGGLDWKTQVKPICQEYGDWLKIVTFG